MANDVVAQIRQCENDAKMRIEKAGADAAESLRRVKSEADTAVENAKEKCRLDFEKSCEISNEEAKAQYEKSEADAMEEAKNFIRQSSSNLSDAVKFIVGGIIGQWQ